MPSADSMDLGPMYNALPGGEEQARPPITYLHIHEDAKLSLGIFRLPARARIPLHNHPGMTVMSRVLYGQMHVQSCDWVDTTLGGTLPRKAVKVLDDVFCARDDPIVLFPSSGGNIHAFTALTDCAVLDVMTPPYSTDEGRDCTYYREVAGEPDSRRGGVVLLDSFEPPDDFVIDHADYHGQPIRPAKPPQRPAGASRGYTPLDLAEASSALGLGSAAAALPPSASPGSASPPVLSSSSSLTAYRAAEIGVAARTRDVTRGVVASLQSFA